MVDSSYMVYYFLGLGCTLQKQGGDSNSAQGAGVRHRQPHGRFAPQESGANRSQRYPRPPGSGEGQVHPALRPSGGEHRYGKEFHQPFHGHQ